jgi:hypothetical protein
MQNKTKQKYNVTQILSNKKLDIYSSLGKVKKAIMRTFEVTLRSYGLW